MALVTQNISLRIGGMTCVSCQNRIEKKLKNTEGVEEASVNYNTGTAVLAWDPSRVSLDEIKAAIESLDYTVLDGKDKNPVLEILGTLVIILSLYVLLRGLGVNAVTGVFTPAETGMGYGMLFVIGIVTSFHCAAMCGGINLSQCIPAAALQMESGRRQVLLPSILYNAGRVISYTAVGVIVGALGSAVSVSGRFQGVVQLIAGVFMVIMGINMLGVFPGLRRFTPHLPKFLVNKINYQKSVANKSINKSPLIVGLLNGFMPCGPLQAMQLYALSTGSPISGGISMFLFSMGTVPIMFSIGALSSLLSKKFTRIVMKTGAILVTVMGMTMFTYGWGLSGINTGFMDKALAAVNPFISGSGGTGGAFIPVVENGYQIINSTLNAGSYPAITVQQGIPVRWNINAPQGSINGCNNRMIIREYGIEYRFRPGDNVIEFVPEKSGRFSYSCWMGMIRSSITVVAEGQNSVESGDTGLSPVPAGVVIPTDTIRLAEIKGPETYGFPYQTVTVNLRDDGISPAIIVFKRNMPALLVIDNDSLDPGNSRLIFPSYYERLDIRQGENALQIMPREDFDFSTGDNVFYAYVKIVDDLEKADIEAIKTEAGNYETQIYPDAYFEPASAAGCGGGCCGGAGY